MAYVLKMEFIYAHWMLLIFVGGYYTHPFQELPPAFIICFLPAGLALSLKFKIFRLLTWYVSGFVWACVISHTILEKSLDPDLEGQEVVVVGNVSSLPKEYGRYIQFDLDVLKILDRDGIMRPSPGRIRLNWYIPYPLIVPGDSLEVVAKLKRPTVL